MADRSDGEGRPTEYWGTLQGQEFASRATEVYADNRGSLRTSRRHERMRRMWLNYYSRGENGTWTEDGTEIGTGGVQGELTTIRPNHLRNLIQHQLNLVTQNPPARDVVAINSDSESLAQAVLANGILDYYHRVHGLARYRVERAEVALVLGESFLHVPWDASAGAEVGVEDYEDEDGQPAQRTVHEGDFRFSVGTPYNCVYDPHSPNRDDPRWVMFSEPVNRWDLIEKCPAYREQILQAEPVTDAMDGWGYVPHKHGGDDYVTVTWVYFAKSQAMPEGRMSLLLDAETVLMDGPLPYERPPVFRLAPSDVIFQPGGYTNNFDLLPLVQAYQSIVTTILSNQTVFGVQLVAAQTGSNIKPNQLARGLHLLEYNGDRPPEALQLTASAPESFEFARMMMGDAEKLAVINAAVRGDPEATKGDSGSKAALIHSTAQQFASGFSQHLAESDEAIDTHILFTLRDFTRAGPDGHKRIATIAGKHNAYASREFSGDDLDPIARVVVKAANAMKDTLQGKMELADKLMSLPNGIQTADQYLEFMSTGRLEPMYEGPMAELMLIRRENEALVDPDNDQPEPLVAPMDQHAQHIDEHKCKLADPRVRYNPALVRRMQEHIMWHIESLTPGMPRFAGFEMLAATGQQPFPGPGQAPGPPPPGQPPGPPGPPESTAEPGGDGMPDMPQPPKNPLTGQRADVPVPEA